MIPPFNERIGRRAITLVELLVAIAVVGVLISLLLPAVQAGREASRRLHCSSNLRQLGLAVQAYHDSYSVLPALATSKRKGVGNLSFLVRLLPFVEQDALSQEVKWDESYDSKQHVSKLNSARVVLYQCPSSSGVNSGPVPGYTSHYYGVMGPKGPGYGLEIRPSGANGGRATDGPFLVDQSLSFAAIIDGTSNTLLLGEISWNKANCYRSWTRGAEIAAANPGKNVAFGLRQNRYTFENLNDVSFGAEHSGGCNFSRVDGSIFFLNETIELKIFQALASRNGGETVQP